jgi:hypothetical protein
MPQSVLSQSALAAAPVFAPAVGVYPTDEVLLARLQRAAMALGARQSYAGLSVERRPILRFDFGTVGKPVVLMSALMHGVEVIGGLALLDVLEKLARAPQAKALFANAHWVVLPVLNPDALANNLGRHARGFRAWQRCNARGVDLNRNFPRISSRRSFHPLSGSRFRASPYYAGPHELSEPESRAVRDVAIATRPFLSLAFHSFGNLLLYPWAHTAEKNPRTRAYHELGRELTSGLRRFPYELRQARSLYSMVGEMDDWLDAELGTLAYTVEVSRPTLSLRRLGRLFNPFCWMNPESAAEVVEDLSPGVLALLTAAVGQRV